MEDRYQRLRDIVESELSCSAHNMEHVIRVYNLCLFLVKDESSIDMEVLKTAALLHDIARIKEDEDDSGGIDHAVLGAEIAENILRDLDYPIKKIEQIKHCISAHRFRSSIKPKTKEAKILFDADKLDAIGAIGIARSFIIAGQYGEKTYSDVQIEEYIEENLVGGRSDGRIKDISRHAPNIEFELKFRNVPSKLYTPLAREIAEQKMKFMTMFYEILRIEMNGDYVDNYQI